MSIAIPRHDFTFSLIACYSDIVLKNLSVGPKNFIDTPVGVVSRVNWEFVVSLGNLFGPLLADAPPPPLRARCLWLFPPVTPHGWRSSGTVQRAMFQFGFVPEPLSTHVIQRSWHACPISRENAHELFALASFLQPHFEKPSAFGNIHFQAALYRLSQLAIGNIPLREFPKPDNLDTQISEMAMAWFAEHMHENPTLEDVARAVRMSPGHLRRIFWSARKGNPHSILTEMRIRRAMEMMSGTGAKLETIAETAGFGSAANFARAFRRIKGISPSEWKMGRLS